MKQNMFRKNTRVHYEILPLVLDDGSIDRGSFLLNFHQIYELHNLSGSEQVYYVTLSVERTPLVDKPNVCIVVDGIPLDHTKIAEADESWENTNEFMRYKYPVHVKSNSFKELQFRASLVKLRSDTEVWRALAPSDGAMVTISHPETLDLSFDLLHPDAASDLVQTSVVTSFRIKRPLLAHNGFMFWWREKPTLTKASPTEAVAVSETEV